MSLALVGHRTSVLPAGPQSEAAGRSEGHTTPKEQAQPGEGKGWRGALQSLQSEHHLQRVGPGASKAGLRHRGDSRGIDTSAPSDMYTV